MRLPPRPVVPYFMGASLEDGLNASWIQREDSRGSTWLCAGDIAGGPDGGKPKPPLEAAAAGYLQTGRSPLSLWHVWAIVWAPLRHISIKYTVLSRARVEHIWSTC